MPLVPRFLSASLCAWWAAFTGETRGTSNQLVCPRGMMTRFTVKNIIVHLFVPVDIEHPMKKRHLTLVVHMPQQASTNEINEKYPVISSITYE